MRRRNVIFSLFIVVLLLSACAPNRKGMRKSKKKGCDCPSFSQLNPSDSHSDIIQFYA
jgi:hypothetical protein